MRKLTALIATTVLVATLSGTSLSAAADTTDDDTGFVWDVITNTGTSGPDVTGHLWLNGKNGGGQGDQYGQIGGESQEQFNARMRAFYEQQATFCNRMFLDVESQRLLTTVDAINLRNRYMVQCLAPGAGSIVAPNPPPSPAALGAEAVAALTLPDATPMVGPDPSRNKWNMVAIGYPIWLWTEGVDTLTASASVRGHTISLVARRTSVSFSMGDGQKVSCIMTTAWVPGVRAGAPSPTCGYTYAQTGQYRVAALAQWQVTWSVLGESGTIPVAKGAARQLPVGELQAVVVR